MNDARRGWLVVAATTLAMVASFPTVLYYLQNLFLQPMTREFGWSQSQFVAPVSLSLLCGAFLPVFVGIAADRWGIRRIVVPGVALFGLATMSLGLVTSLWQYMLLSVLAGAASYGHSPILYAKAIASWLKDRRGLAIAVSLSGLAIGNLIYPPLTEYLIRTCGWRWARAATGATILLVSLPLVLAFVREKPLTEAAAARPEIAEGFTLGQAVRTREFWQFAIALLLCCSAFNGLLVMLVPLAATRGIDATTAAHALAWMGVSQIFGRLVSGRLLDRFDRPQIGALWFGIAASGVATIAVAAGPGTLAAGTVLLGLALGAELELAAYFTIRFFGLARFSRIYGLMISIYSAGGALGPLVMSGGNDLTGSFAAPLAFLLAGSLVATVLILLMPRYRFAARPPGD